WAPAAPPPLPRRREIPPLVPPSLPDAFFRHVRAPTKCRKSLARSASAAFPARIPPRPAAPARPPAPAGHICPRTIAASIRSPRAALPSSVNRSRASEAGSWGGGRGRFREGCRLGKVDDWLLLSDADCSKGREHSRAARGKAPSLAANGRAGSPRGARGGGGGACVLGRQRLHGRSKHLLRARTVHDSSRYCRASSECASYAVFGEAACSAACGVEAECDEASAGNPLLPRGTASCCLGSPANATCSRARYVGLTGPAALAQCAEPLECAPDNVCAPPAGSSPETNWIIGVCVSVMGSVTLNVGLNIQKFAYKAAEAVDECDRLPLYKTPVRWPERGPTPFSPKFVSPAGFADALSPRARALGPRPRKVLAFRVRPVCRREHRQLRFAQLRRAVADHAARRGGLAVERGRGAANKQGTHRPRRHRVHTFRHGRLGHCCGVLEPSGTLLLLVRPDLVLQDRGHNLSPRHDARLDRGDLDFHQHHRGQPAAAEAVAQRLGAGFRAVCEHQGAGGGGGQAGVRPPARVAGGRRREERRVPRGAAEPAGSGPRPRGRVGVEAAARAVGGAPAAAAPRVRVPDPVAGHRARGVRRPLAAAVQLRHHRRDHGRFDRALRQVVRAARGEDVGRREPVRKLVHVRHPAGDGRHVRGPVAGRGRSETIYYINLGLRNYDALLQVPVYYVVWTVFGVVCGGVYFGEFRGFDVRQATLFFLGIFCVFVGVSFLANRLKEAALDDLDQSDDRPAAGAAAGPKRKGDAPEKCSAPAAHAHAAAAQSTAAVCSAAQAAAHSADGPGKSADGKGEGQCAADSTILKLAKVDQGAGHIDHHVAPSSIASDDTRAEPAGNENVPIKAPAELLR
ncbi:MAG: hypothetical protein BJ554DRAFT_4675, partial [Olpidium bornovanus]